MGLNGQAGDSPESIDSLADFLADNPDGADEQEELTPNAEESDEDNSESENPEDAPAEDDDESSETAKEQPSATFEVVVKGEDGTDTTVKVDQKELISGYQRHADYTRKTTELANREREVTQVLAGKAEQQRDHYMQQAQLAHAAVRQLAGLRSQQEMAELAQVDPAGWVQENQRAQAIQGVLQQLEQGVNQERAQSQHQMQEAKARQYERAWAELSKDGIDKPKLTGIFQTMTAKYGVPAERLANVDDPAVVRIMRDAAAYQDLLARKATVTKKATSAPALPAQRQSVPRNEQRNQALNKRFATGSAKLGDLAAYLESM